MSTSPAGQCVKGLMRAMCIALVLALAVGCASSPVPVLSTDIPPPAPGEQIDQESQTESEPKPKEVDWAAVAWITAALILVGVLIANSTRSTVRGQSG